jgi:hypothetical protein
VEELRRWWWVVAAVAFALWATAAARSSAAFTPTSDTAVIESFTRLAASGDLSLGPYSRFQWHHPGPIAFYAMAPGYVLGGSNTTALNASVLLVNLVVLAAAITIAIRYASPVLAIAISGSLAWLVWRVPDLLTSPWNAHLPVLAAGAMLLAASAAIARARPALPATAVFASLAAQTHVALLPVALASGAAALIGFAAMTVWSAQRRHLPVDARSMALALALTDVTVLALWAPTLVEQLTSDSGNLGLIWKYFVEQSHQTPPIAIAVSAWADMLTGPLRPDFYLAQGWRFVESPVLWAEAVAGLQVCGLVAACWYAWRDRRQFDAALSGLLLVASSIALWSATRIDGDIYDHAVFWIAIIGALNIAVCVSLAARLVLGAATGNHARTTADMVAVLAVAVALLAGGGSLHAAVARAAAPSEESRAAADMATALRAMIIDRGLQRPLIRFDQDAWGMAAGVVLDLQRTGVAVAVEDDWLAMYTPAFRATGHEPADIALVGRAEHTRRAGDPAQRLIASSPLLFAYLSTR